MGTTKTSCLARLGVACIFLFCFYSSANDPPKDRVIVGKTFRVDVGESVDELVVIGGEGTIAGHIRELVSIGSRIRFTDSSQVDGDFVSIGSHVVKEPGAQIVSQSVEISIPKLSSLSQLASQPLLWPFVWSWPWKLSWTLATLLLCCAVGTLYLNIAPHFHTSVVHYLWEKKIESFGIGLLAHILCVPLAITLVFSIVGIPLLPLYAIIVAAIWCLSYLSFAYVLGERLLKRKLPGWQILGVGLLLLAVLRWIPFVGSLLVGAGLTMGLGAFFATLFNRRKGVTLLSGPKGSG